SVMASAGIRMHDDMIERSAEHHGNFATKRLRILVVSIDVHGTIGLDVGNGHRRTYRRVLHVWELIGGGKFLVSRCERGACVTLGGVTLGDGSAGPIGFLPEMFVEFCV